MPFESMIFIAAVIAAFTIFGLCLLACTIYERTDPRHRRAAPQAPTFHPAPHAMTEAVAAE